MLDTVAQAMALEVRDVRKEYGSTCALNGVSFRVKARRIHALLGGNGSGKSTFIKILAGVENGTAEGNISVRGESVSPAKTSPEWARDHGISFVHQDLGLFDSLTVAENLFVGAGFPHWRGTVRWHALMIRARRLLDDLQIAVDPGVIVQRLRPAQRTLIAVARALRGRSDDDSGLLVLDEPTASLPATECQWLLDALARLRDRGQTILYVTHRLDEVLRVADDITVFRDGDVVETRPVAGLSQRTLNELIAGRPLDSVFPSADLVASESDVLLSATGIGGGPLSGASVTVRRGEIVGIAGLAGSGRTSLLESIFGLHPRCGAVLVNGRPLTGGVDQAIERGLAYVPADRLAEGAFIDLSVAVNTAAGHDRDFFARGVYHARRERQAARSLIERLGIKAGGSDAPIGSLSGGNQQKVMLARWLHPTTKVLLLDEPTQGVDVGARADIYAEIAQLRNEGLGILLVSSDDEELLGLADTVVVLRQGRVAARRPRSSVDRAWLTEAVHGIGRSSHHDDGDTP
jgi:ABC-type sugar transport system ATPase subunit